MKGKDTRMSKTLLKLLCITLALSACGGRKDDDQTQARRSGIGQVRQDAGTSVFVARLSFDLRNYPDLASVAYTITPRPGSYSRPLAVTFDKTWLDRRQAYASGSRLELPVFGLYASHANRVALSARFRDGSQHAFGATLETGAYSGPAQTYTTPVIHTARGPGRTPGFDFMMFNNRLGPPVVIDTDGYLRWSAAGIADSTSTMFSDGIFHVGSQRSPVLHRMDIDGSFTSVPVGAPSYTDFHHELAPGKTGMLAALNTVEDGVARIESNLVEIDANGRVLREWDLGRIFSAHMRAGGDNPANFVRDGFDWFHMNHAIYNPADNSLLLSSREHFVVKLDYDTGAIRWLLGDTSKHWYVNYPSLRALALKVAQGKPPIGQHSLSVAPDGQLLLFNNGYGSLNHPPGSPAGLTRTYSTPSRYAIDEQAGTAREVWTYEHDRKFYSNICSSVYEGAPGTFLVAYSVAFARTQARLLGIDSQGRVAFDFAYPTRLCDTVFSARPLAWSDLRLR
jgi:arylsulfate sulfotransferase